MGKVIRKGRENQEGRIARSCAVGGNSPLRHGYWFLELQKKWRGAIRVGGVLVGYTKDLVPPCHQLTIRPCACCLSGPSFSVRKEAR